tara:strand:- start:28 stop:183 length:156 start_codon:yes stop_codon:yes gene_type:complete
MIIDGMIDYLGLSQPALVTARAQMACNIASADLRLRIALRARHCKRTLAID